MIGSVLCDHFEGWDREYVGEMQEGGDRVIYLYVDLIHFVIQHKLTQCFKAIILQKDVKKKRKLIYLCLTSRHVNYLYKSNC